MAKHKWHKEIKAWADGDEIEYKGTYEDESGWEDDENPDWFCDTHEFRIKPQLKKPKYLYVYWNSKIASVELFFKKEGDEYDFYIGKIKLENDDES